jgi:hypothetical protein
VILTVTKMGLSETLLWRARAEQPVALLGCCLREMLRSLKPMPESAKTTPVQPLSKALEPIGVYQSISNVETTRALDRQSEIDCQIRPHELRLHLSVAFWLHGSWNSSVVLVSAS